MPTSARAVRRPPRLRLTPSSTARPPSQAHRQQPTSALDSTGRTDAGAPDARVAGSDGALAGGGGDPRAAPKRCRESESGPGAPSLAKDPHSGGGEDLADAASHTEHARHGIQRARARRGGGAGGARAHVGGGAAGVAGEHGGTGGGQLRDLKKAQVDALHAHVEASQATIVAQVAAQVAAQVTAQVTAQVAALATAQMR